MKKSILTLSAIVLLLVVAPAHVRASADPRPLSMPSSVPVESPEVRTMLNRLAEIDAMDKSTLSRVEKKALRKEVRNIEKDIKSNGGVYLSVGALLLVIILLIVLL